MRKKYGNFFFASLKSMKKGVGSGVGSGSGAGAGNGSGSISQNGSGDPDPLHPKCHGSPTLP
jgi:hypothetical protein